MFFWKLNHDGIYLSDPDIFYQVNRRPKKLLSIHITLALAHNEKIQQLVQPETSRHNNYSKL